jgi:hypothetical protein
VGYKFVVPPTRSLADAEPKPAAVPGRPRTVVPAP